jgi:hypothetical protein
MLVLGIVVVAFLIVHLIQFWSKMQLQELLSSELADLPTLEDTPVAPAQGTLFLQMAFSQIWTPIVYIIGFVALWFHMTHGFWSMFHTCGWDNNTWLPRLKKIANWWTSIVVVLFVAQAIVFTVRAQSNYYTENEALQEQYSEFWGEKAKALTEDFQSGFYAQIADLVKDREAQMANQQEIMKRQQEYLSNEGPKFVEAAKAIEQAVKSHCSNVVPAPEVQQLMQMSGQIEQQIQMSQMMNHENK